MVISLFFERGFWYIYYVNHPFAVKPLCNSGAVCVYFPVSTSGICMNRTKVLKENTQCGARTRYLPIGKRVLYHLATHYTAAVRCMLLVFISPVD